MALTKGVNSFVALSEANEYLADRLDVAAWNEADDSQKSQAIVTATTMLDNLAWVGQAVSSSQSLAFPRKATYYDPKFACWIELTESTGIPKRIQNACCELAYHLINNDGMLDDTGAVADINISGITLKDIRNPNKLPTLVRQFISPLLANSGSRMWWRSN